jgi:hypothetical protein
MGVQRLGPLFGNQQPSLIGRQPNYLADGPAREVHTIDLLGELAHQTHAHVSHTQRAADANDVHTPFRLNAA